MRNQLTKKEKHQVIDLLIKYENVFAFSMKDLGKCKTMQFSIDLTNETPKTPPSSLMDANVSPN
jgi:hypothetical protein